MQNGAFARLDALRCVMDASSGHPPPDNKHLDVRRSLI